jgi:hypothetical protein
VSASGSKTVHVTGNTTFRLTANGTGGSDTHCVDSVTVERQQESAVCNFLSADRTTVPYSGGNVTLTWETTNATSVSINGVSAPADGSKTVFVGSATTYTLTATGAGGNASCNVKINLGDKPHEDLPRCDFLRVSDDNVEEGDYVTLTWETTNADDVHISGGVGDVADDGSTRVRIDDDTTFRLTASNTEGTDECEVDVEVDQQKKEKDARCDLTISDRSVHPGDEITLEWDVRDADEFTIKDNHGNTIYRDRNPGSREEGDKDIVIDRDTTFTLEADGKDGGDDDTCRVSVDTEDNNVLVLTNRDQGRVAGISLTQVPYTGFDAGPMMTFLFYALLVAWALYVAYVLVIKKDSLFGFSLASAGTIMTDEPTETPAYAAATAAPVTDAPANLPIGTPVYGYAAYAADTEEETETEATDELTRLEERAHSQKVLFSSDALRYFAATAEGDQIDALDAVIRTAKASYPSEDGWMVLNLARVEELMGANSFVPVASILAESPAVTGTGSLAEAIATGNIAAAYQLIEHRPMVALAEAAAEFDAIYRMHQGMPNTNVVVSDLLKAEVATHSLSNLSDAIAALTGALDGTYTDEASAVKMAILKAVRAFTA